MYDIEKVKLVEGSWTARLASPPMLQPLLETQSHLNERKCLCLSLKRNKLVYKLTVFTIVVLPIIKL